MNIKLYDEELSGNCYKVRLLMSLLGVEYELVSINLKAGEHKSTKFLRLNPLGQVPVLTHEDFVIADSQAILVYLARKYGAETWLPNNAESSSLVVRWLMISASEIRYSVAAARLFYLFQMKTIDLDTAIAKSAVFLQQLEQHLSGRKWLELDRPTVADVAVFPYVALAPDGRIDLQPYPQILAWCDRLKQLPGFIFMPGI